MEIVLSIIAIVVSAVSLFFNAYPVYCKYMRKKEKTIITITDCKIENGIIKLCVVYSNLEYRGIIITNSYIMLMSSSLSNNYTNSNNVSSNKWIEPIIFTGKGITVKIYGDVSFNLIFNYSRGNIDVFV